MERIHLPMQETWVQSLGQEDSPGEGNGNPLQYFSLGNPMDREAWWATVHDVARDMQKEHDLVTKQQHAKCFRNCKVYYQRVPFLVFCDNLIYSHLEHT